MYFRDQSRDIFREVTPLSSRHNSVVQNGQNIYIILHTQAKLIKRCSPQRPSFSLFEKSNIFQLGSKYIQEIINI